jgi:hypothetical protein
MGITIDLKKAHLSRFHGDLCAVYTWVNEERALVLVPWRRKGAPWYIVMENVAYKYDDPEYLATQCQIACEHMGMEPTTANWVRVATIINEGLPDLIKMPDAPPQQFSAASYGAHSMTADGETVAQEDIRVPINEGVTYG